MCCQLPSYRSLTLAHYNPCVETPRYETRKHLWLVLEYCVGGNLCALLEADGKLPEESIRIFMRDVALALQHMHERVRWLPISLW